MGYIGVITHLLLTNHLLTSWDIRPCWWYPSSTKPVESEETQKLVELQNEKNPPALTKKISIILAHPKLNTISMDFQVPVKGGR